MHLKPPLHTIESACKEGNIVSGMVLLSGFLSSATEMLNTYTFIKQKNKPKTNH